MSPHSGAFQMALMLKNQPANAGDVGSIPGSGRSPGEGNDNPLQDSRLGNVMDKGASWATVHGVAKSWTRLSDFTSLVVIIQKLCLEYPRLPKIIIFIYSLF